jgi:activated CDC42 kinase 1
MPTDRPTFEALKDFLAETMPTMVRAREGVEEEGRMSVETGDIILIIEGRAENYWWKGNGNCFYLKIL